MKKSILITYVLGIVIEVSIFLGNLILFKLTETYPLVWWPIGVLTFFFGLMSVIMSLIGNGFLKVFKNDKPW